MTRIFDVLGLGVVTIDDLIYVESYPPPDAKTPVLWSERQCGGLTATALVAAARLGSKCVYAGVLGDDELSRFVKRRLQEEGIDLAYVVKRADACPVHSLIIVDQSKQTRNIFFEFTGAVGADSHWPEAEVIRAARVLFVDQYGMEGMIRAARIAHEANIPVVGDFERFESSPYFPELMALTDHLIISQDFAQVLTGQSDPAAAATALLTNDRKVVVVTCGDQGSWYLNDLDKGLRHQPAYPVQAVDTTGCGDVFHGAYASALARGLSLPQRVRFASAAAALKATQPGGQAGIPTQFVVEQFLMSRG